MNSSPLDLSASPQVKSPVYYLGNCESNDNIFSPGEQFEVSLDEAALLPAVAHGRVEEVVHGHPTVLEGRALKRKLIC